MSWSCSPSRRPSNLFKGRHKAAPCDQKRLSMFWGAAGSAIMNPRPSRNLDSNVYIPDELRPAERPSSSLPSTLGPSHNSRCQILLHFPCSAVSVHFLHVGRGLVV